jgi:hypothetical protein
MIEDGSNPEANQRAAKDILNDQIEVGCSLTHLFEAQYATDLSHETLQDHA